MEPRFAGGLLATGRVAKGICGSILVPVQRGIARRCTNETLVYIPAPRPTLEDASVDSGSHAMTKREGNRLKSRMAIWESQDKIRRRFLYGCVLADLAYGLLNMFGRAEGASQILIRSMLPSGLDWFVPGLILLSAMLLLIGWSAWGGIAGTMGWGANTVAILWTIGSGTSLSTGGWVPYAFVWYFHVSVIISVVNGTDADREERQRRS